MESYKAKSILIGRKKRTKEYDRDDVRPCFISLFKENDPHKTAEVPFDMLEFDSVHKIFIKGLDVSYLLPGNDIIINNLESFELDVDGPHITVSGKQKE